MKVIAEQDSNRKIFDTSIESNATTIDGIFEIQIEHKPNGTIITNIHTDNNNNTKS